MKPSLTFAAGIQNNPYGQRFVAAMEIGPKAKTKITCTLISNDPLFYCDIVPAAGGAQ